MKKLILAIFMAAILVSNSQAAPLKVTVGGIDDGAPIPEKFAHCVAKGADKSADGENTSPLISWEKGPDGTKSYAVIVVDRDVPTNFDNANKDGKTIEEAAPRQNFYHWIVLNIPVNITSIAEGKGKEKGFGDQLVNDFLKFSGLKKTGQNIKKFVGYDGPCPPWNDERVHNYHFKVYALSDSFNLGDDFESSYTGNDIVHKIAPFILAEGEVIGTYTLNPALKPDAPKAAIAPTATAPAESKQ